jgi:hypothetical protein
MNPSNRALLCVLSFSMFACGGAEATAPPPDVPSAAPRSPTPAAEDPAAEPDHGPEPQAETKAPKDEPKAQKETSEAAPKAPADVPGANLTIGELEADGLKTKDIACKTEGGAMALFGMVLVTAWMAPQKAALDACAKAGAETRVSWKARGGKVTEISASGDAKTKACVERALSSGKPVLEGHCAATVLHGK